MSLIAFSSFRVSSPRLQQAWLSVQHHLPLPDISNVPSSFCQKPLCSQEPDFGNSIQQAATKAHDVAGSTLPHPRHIMLSFSSRFSLFKRSKRREKKLQSSSEIQVDFNFFLLCLIFLILSCISHGIKELLSLRF